MCWWISQFGQNLRFLRGSSDFTSEEHFRRLSQRNVSVLLQVSADSFRFFRLSGSITSWWSHLHQLLFFTGGFCCKYDAAPNQSSDHSFRWGCVGVGGSLLYQEADECPELEGDVHDERKAVLWSSLHLWLSCCEAAWSSDHTGSSTFCSVEAQRRPASRLVQGILEP